MKQLKHSVGLQKSLVKIVNAYASKSQAGQNNIIIAHEFLHTVGAGDKYGAFSNPLVSDGLGNPISKSIRREKLKLWSAKVTSIPTNLKCLLDSKISS